MSEGGRRTASNAAQATARRAPRGSRSRFGTGPCGPPPEACADARPEAGEASFTPSLARWPATWLTIGPPLASPAVRAWGAARRSGVTPLHDGVEPDGLWTGKDAAAIRLAHAARCPRRSCHGRRRHVAQAPAASAHTQALALHGPERWPERAPADRGREVDRAAARHQGAYRGPTVPSPDCRPLQESLVAAASSVAYMTLRRSTFTSTRRRKPPAADTV